MVTAGQTQFLPLSVTDAPALATLHYSAFGVQAWTEAQLAASLRQPNVSGLQLRHDDVLAGFALCQAVAEDGEILTYAVHPAFQRRGLGRALLVATVAVARAQPWQKLFLEVAEDNAPALRLYIGYGFKVSGKRPGYYPRQQGAVAALLLHYDL